MSGPLTVDQLTGHINTVTGVYYIPKDGVFITGSEDQSVR